MFPLHSVTQLRFLLRVCPIPDSGKGGPEINEVIAVIRRSCDPSKWRSSRSEGDVGWRWVDRRPCVRGAAEQHPAASESREDASEGALHVMD